jgi:hypothetical protein
MVERSSPALSGIPHLIPSQRSPEELEEQVARRPVRASPIIVPARKKVDVLIV